MHMDATSSYCSSRGSKFPSLHYFITTIVLLWHLTLLSLPILFVGAQYSNNPSANWTLPYPGYTNFTVCNNGSSYLELLNDAQGLYGRRTGIYSPNYYMPYTVYFSLYFVIAGDNLCMKDNDERNESIAAYYLSLVALNAYGKIQDPNKGQVIWTANPLNPVTQNACLRLDDSHLELVDYESDSTQTLWKTWIGVESNLSLGISFQGNLFLFSNDSASDTSLALWESFGYPADTLMVLQVLEEQKTLNVHSSATSNAGNYTLALENGRLVLYARIGPQLDDGENPNGSPYWVGPHSSIPANDHIDFAAFCWDSDHQLRMITGSNRFSNDVPSEGMVSPEFCQDISNNNTVMNITGLKKSINATFATFLRLEADGDLRAYTVDDTTYPGSRATWRAFYSVFNNTPCSLPLSCGFYGMCDPQRPHGTYCRCNYSDDLKLVFADASNDKQGCKPENAELATLWNVQNESSSRQGAGEGRRCATIENIAACSSMDCRIEFLEIHNVSYFSLNFNQNYQRVYGISNGDGCKGECERNCSCTAAFWNQSTLACFQVHGRLGTIQAQGTTKAFIKYVILITPSSSSLFLSGNWKLVGPVLAVVLLVLAGIFLAYLRRRREHKMSELRKERSLLFSLLDGNNVERFTWRQMHDYTCGFSDLLGGGGFGRVFRGALRDGTAIAVKQLDDLGQGDKEFVAEVSILSRIHHAHLVRLIGFCSEGLHRLLVYEYMENGSLDAWLFRNHLPSGRQEHHDTKEKGKGKGLLPWKMRFQIAVGTAKGLAYLHEECEERVIHMDLKPQNILLGCNFQPKISDFGMSRRTSREQTSVMTVMRGTPGYLAPEWLVDCAVTEKCDVYSFGIMLLEMVSGRRVKDVRAVKQKLSMRSLKESVMFDFVDESLRYGSDVDEKETVRMVEVALLCARTDPTKRPAMSSVALMLEGKEEVVQDVDELVDDDAEEQQQLVMYPSAMNRTMRMQLQQKQQGKLDNFANSSLTASSGVGNSGTGSTVFWSSFADDNNDFSEIKKKNTKYLNSSQLKTKASSSHEEEWDRLLH